MTGQTLPSSGVRLGLDAMRTRFEVVLPGVLPISADGVSVDSDGTLGSNGDLVSRGALCSNGEASSRSDLRSSGEAFSSGAPSLNGDIPPRSELCSMAEIEEQAARLRAAAEAALEEIRAAERTFNFFDPQSWLSKVNKYAAATAVKVPFDVFELLQLCADVHQQSNGAFDPSVASSKSSASARQIAPPTPAPWSNSNQPAPSLPATGRTSGFEHVQLIAATREVRFTQPNIKLDLGGVAKGWAIDRAVEVLQEAGVTSALVQGGTSSMRGIGNPSGIVAHSQVQSGRQQSEIGWKIAIGENASTWLHNQALSVSHTFASGDANSTKPCHIIHPRSGCPVRQPRMAAVLSPSAALADAWSTALLVDACKPFTWKQIP